MHFRYAVVLPKLFIFWLNLHISFTIAEISCLVMRPGFGLVSEQCPASSVGCRIRANKDHIEWYDWARLYDRNQLVCVYPGEYPTLTGCVKKPSGNVRCWCGGRKDCNNPETSRDIYEAFLAGDTTKLSNIANWLKKPVDENEDPIEKALKNKLHGSSRPTRPPKHHHQKTTILPTDPPTTKTSVTSVTSTTAKITTIKSTTSKITTTRKPRHRVTAVKVTTSKSPKKSTTTASTTKLVGTTTEDPLIKTQKDLELETDKVLNLSSENNDLKLGDTFEETRRKLQKEMRDEEKRMAEYFADEDKEKALDEEDGIIETAEEQRQKEREQYMQRRHRDDYERNIAEEEERLARMEREEERNPDKDDDYENSDDGGEFEEEEKEEKAETFRRIRDRSDSGLFENSSDSRNNFAILILTIFALQILRL